MPCAQRARGSRRSAWCGNTSPSTTSPHCEGSSRPTTRRRPEQGGVEANMGATTPAPKSRRRSHAAAHPQRSAAAAAPRLQVAPAERIGLARRFAFFCLAALTALPEIAPDTQVLHSHDWHTALAPVYLRTAFSGEPFYKRLAVVMSVHNAGFQGHFPPDTMAQLGLPVELYNVDVFEWYGRMNALKGALAFSDVAVTVSPTHAKELCTPEGGFGLHDRFGALGDRLVGILNGIDPDLWNPETDSELTGNYSDEDLSGKRRCKTALQRAYGLAQRGHTPLFGMSARMVAQKGLDLVLGADLLGTSDAQLIFL